MCLMQIEQLIKQFWKQLTSFNIAVKSDNVCRVQHYQSSIISETAPLFLALLAKHDFHFLLGPVTIKFFLIVNFLKFND